MNKSNRIPKNDLLLVIFQGFTVMYTNEITQYLENNLETIMIFFLKQQSFTTEYINT